MMRRRIMGLALMALVVPFPALALDGGGEAPSGPGSLTVTASLNGCGLGGSQIMCKIDAGWNSLEGAESYTVSVTSADGSVVDYGSTSGQGTSIWVPYVGSGTYSVLVTAWGTPPGEEEDGSAEVLARAESVPGDGAQSVSEDPPALPASENARDLEEAAPTTDEPAVPDVEVPADPRDETPVCEERPTDEPPAPSEPEPEPAPAPAERGTADAALDEPEVVDTIPVDDDYCAR